MKRMTMQEAIVAAIAAEMRRDPDVFIMGLDIGRFGGPLNSCKGLWEEFGASGRVIDTPISEGAIVGAGVGAALAGKRPIVDIMFCEYLPLVIQQLGCDAGAMHYYSGGAARVPLVVRGKYGVGPYHGHAYDHHAWLMHTPGVKVVVPSTALDARGLMTAAIRDDNPVFFMEHMALYHGQRDAIPDEDFVIPLGRAEVKRPGRDVTVVASGAMVRKALAAARVLAGDGIEVEIVDLRSIVPLDEATILESVHRTGRALVVQETIRGGGSTAEVAALIGARAWRELKAPVERLGAEAVPMPFARSLERAAVPDETAITRVLRHLAAQ
ncbi:MAG: alpha-ketoacid dehydrogenase subunit beta [Burkholderiales bacterium]|nr:alpha-ketoacid dehydrogenase subunit beta [Burkholderiales bacterium]